MLCDGIFRLFKWFLLFLVCTRDHVNCLYGRHLLEMYMGLMFKYRNDFLFQFQGPCRCPTKQPELYEIYRKESDIPALVPISLSTRFYIKPFMCLEIDVCFFSHILLWSFKNVLYLFCCRSSLILLWIRLHFAEFHLFCFSIHVYYKRLLAY